jgi:hypothetical protein
MREVELTSARLVRVWWAFAWRFAGLWLVLFALSLLASAVTGVFMTRVMGFPHRITIHMVAQVLIATMIMAVPVAGLTAMRVALRGRFGTFRLALLAVPPTPESPAAAP